MSFEEWYDQHFGSADPNVVQAGNIDLGDRPAVYNEDGTVSTERSFSIQDDQYGREVLLPQVVGGRMLSKKDAIKHYRDTGEHLGIYKDIPTANAYAKDIHERIPRLDTPDSFPIGEVMQSIRDLPGWAAYRMYRGATRRDLPGEGPSAREEANVPIPLPPGLLNRDNWSLQNPAKNLRDLKNTILPPGFSVQRGLDSALAPAKWLFNEIRQGVLPDEAIEEIKRNPYSPRSIEYMAQAAISLSGGKGGREVPPGPRPVPRRVWDMWTPTDHPGVKVDEMGNHYEATGTHYDKTTGDSHIVVKPTAPVPPPEGTSTGISPKETTPQDTLISDLAKQAGNNPTTWEQLTPWQKQWFENQWKLGNTPSMKDVPVEGQDNPFQKFLDKLYPKGTSGPFPDPETLPPGELSKPPPEPPSPQKPEPGSVLDNWQKKHGGLNPFSEPPPSVGDDFPEMPPNVTPEQYWKQFQAGGLPGQEGPPEQGPPSPTGKPELTPYDPRNPPNLPPPSGISDDLWLQEHFGTGGATDRTPPNVDPLDSMLSDWAKYMDEKGIDYGQNEPPPVDPQVQKDFDHIDEWWRKMQQNKNRFNWKPPDEHGGNNL